MFFGTFWALVTVLISAMCSESTHLRALTLLVEFPDDSVQVGVLERNMTASHRHFGTERLYVPDT